MKEKLTRDEFSRYWERGTAESRYELWSRIEADREAIRAETREELLRDHFKLGEKVQMRTDTFLGWKAADIVALHSWGDEDIFSKDASNVQRRPTKNRNLTNAEMVEELIKADVGELSVQLGYLDGDTLKRLCDVLHIRTEVDE